MQEIRFIKLPKGETLEVSMSQEFIDRLRLHYGLSPDQKVEDDHVRMYVWGAVNTAVEKAEGSC